MPSRSAPANYVKPPRGLIEAAKKLSGWQPLKHAAKARRLQQVAENLGFRDRMGRTGQRSRRRP